MIGWVEMTLDQKYNLPRFFVPDSNGNRLSHLNPKCTGTLSKVGIPLVLLKIENPMELNGTPVFRVYSLTGDLYAMEEIYDTNLGKDYLNDLGRSYHWVVSTRYIVII